MEAPRISDFDFDDDEDSITFVPVEPTGYQNSHNSDRFGSNDTDSKAQDSEVECMDVAVSPGDVYFDMCDNGPPETIESVLEEWFTELERCPLNPGAISMTFYEIDPGYIWAQNRRLAFRGRALRHERPKKKSHPAQGLISMMNRSMKLPAGINQIVRINPKYDIQLQNVVSNNSKDSETVTSSQYVLHQPEAPELAQSARSKDPCNPFIFPLRFETLEPALVANIEKKWPNEIVVELADAKSQELKSFDFKKWVTGELTTDFYLMLEECVSMVICGYLVNWKAVSIAELKKICATYRIPYLPTSGTFEEASSDFQTLGFYDGSAKHGVHIYAHPESGILADEIVSGLPCALRGFPVLGNGFVVAEVLWPTSPPCTWPSLDQKLGHDMVFISGVNLTNKLYSPVEFELFQDYLLGMLGCSMEQEKIAMSKTKLFIIGNLFGLPSSQELTPEDLKGFQKIAAKLDDFLDSISNAVEVFIIPGADDPTEKLLPQRPFQPILFPKLSKREGAHSLHDPCRLKLILDLNDPSQFLDIILSSGANLTEIKKITGHAVSNPMLAENTLKWSHLNPAYPDIFQMNSLPPKDIFVISDSLPHLYIIGDQPHSDIRTFNNTKIISLPNFSKSYEAVSLQLVEGQFKITPMVFKVLSDDDFY